MEEYKGKTIEELSELLDDLQEQQEVLIDDLDDPDLKEAYDSNEAEIARIKSAMGTTVGTFVGSTAEVEEDLDQNTLDEIEDDEREFAEETFVIPEREVKTTDLESSNFSDLQIDKSIFFGDGGKTKIGIMKEMAKGGFIKDNYWGIDEDEFNELKEEKQLDLGKWYLYYNDTMNEWEATMDGNYTHTFKSLNDLMERKNEIDVFEYNEKLSEEKGEEVITNSKGEIRKYAKGGETSKFWEKTKSLGKKGWEKSKELAHEANERRKENLHLKRKQTAHNVGLETSQIIQDKEEKGEITSKKALQLDKKLLEARDIEIEHYTYPEGPKANYEVKNKVKNLNPMDPYFAKGGKVFKAPKGWRKTKQDEGEKTYKHKDGREIIVSDSMVGTPSFEVIWEIEKSYNWEDWKTKKFPMTKEGTKKMEEFLTKLMSSSYAKGGMTEEQIEDKEEKIREYAFDRLEKEFGNVKDNTYFYNFWSDNELDEKLSPKENYKNYKKWFDEKYAKGGETEKGYLVRLYAGSYQFKNSSESNIYLNTLVDAIEYAKKEMRKQRNYRSSTDKMWAIIKGEGEDIRITEDDVKDYYAKGGDINDGYSYDIEYEDEEGDEYSETFDTIQEAREEIKRLENSDMHDYTIKRKYRYKDGDYLGSFEKGGKIVWVGDMPLDIDGREELTEEEAERLAKEWKEKGYDDVIIEDYAKGGETATDYSGEYRDLRTFVMRNGLREAMGKKYGFEAKDYEDYVRGELGYDTEIIQELAGDNYNVEYIERYDEATGRRDKDGEGVIIVSKTYAKGGLLRVLKDSGFNHHKGSPKNELKHNRGQYIATIGKDNMGEVVHLDKYTPNTKRFISSTSFDNPKKLADYFNKNQLYAKGGRVSKEILSKKILELNNQARKIDDVKSMVVNRAKVDILQKYKLNKEDKFSEYDVDKLERFAKAIINNDKSITKYPNINEFYIGDNYAKGGEITQSDIDNLARKLIEESDYYYELEEEGYSDDVIFEKAQEEAEEMLERGEGFAKGGEIGDKVIVETDTKSLWRGKKLKGEIVSLSPFKIRTGPTSTSVIPDKLIKSVKSYAKGGETASPITNYHRTIMGTLGFDLKVKGMRKAQDFIVYPIVAKTDTIRIQSDKKWGEIHINSGKGILSKSGSTSWHLHADMMNMNVIKFELTPEELEELKTQIKSTSGKDVGNTIMRTDNSGAALLEHGGEIDLNEVDIYEADENGNFTVVIDGDVFDMNYHTMPNMSVNMYAGSRSEYPSDISHWGKKITFEDAPQVIKDKIGKRIEEFHTHLDKGGKIKEDKRKWSHHMWFTNEKPGDTYYYEDAVIDYLIDNPRTFKLDINRRALNKPGKLSEVYKDMGISTSSGYLNPQDIKQFAIDNEKYEWLKIEGDRGSDSRKRTIKKYLDRRKKYAEYAEGLSREELSEQIEMLNTMAWEEKDNEMRSEMLAEVNKMRTQL